MSSVLARAQRSDTQIFLESRGTKWKAQTKQTKSKEGQASMQAAVF